MSKVTRKEVENFLIENPSFAKRSMKYLAIEKVTGIPADVCQKICVWNRRLQDILPNDKKGVELEKEWLANEGMEDIVSLATKALTPPGYVRRDGQLFKII